MSLKNQVVGALCRGMPVLKLCTSIFEKVPDRKDSAALKIVKSVAILDAVVEQFADYNARREALFAGHDLEEKQNSLFVQLFEESGLKFYFDVRKEFLTPEVKIITARGRNGEFFVFKQQNWSNALSANFWVKKGTDLSKIAENIWEIFPDGIQVSLRNMREPGETSNKEIKPIVASAVKFSPNGQKRLDGLVSRHRNFIRDGVGHTYLFYGPPGTGKSISAVAMAHTLGKRTLKLDALCLGDMPPTAFIELLQLLKPDSLILDDVDRVSFSGNASNSLLILEQLRHLNPPPLVILSANDPEKLDVAMLRCGRIDIPVHFGLPDEEQIRELLAMYGHVSEDMVQSLKGLAQANIIGFCYRLKHEKVEDVTSSIQMLQGLAKKAKVI